MIGSGLAIKELDSGFRRLRPHAEGVQGALHSRESDGGGMRPRGCFCELWEPYEKNSHNDINPRFRRRASSALDLPRHCLRAVAEFSLDC